jgi:hypothetical protein
MQESRHDGCVALIGDCGEMPELLKFPSIVPGSGYEQLYCHLEI